MAQVQVEHVTFMCMMNPGTRSRSDLYPGVPSHRAGSSKQELSLKEQFSK